MWRTFATLWPHGELQRISSRETSLNVLLEELLHGALCPCRCDLCCLSFRTHRGLLRHNAGVHKLLPQDPNGRPFIQNNPSIPTGFNDLAFIDFSCKKFAQIAQVCLLMALWAWSKV